MPVMSCVLSVAALLEVVGALEDSLAVPLDRSVMGVVHIVII